ncbi:type II secretion system F family protein [Nocardiopsis ansamitocini]|uniref:Membrane protein n=1 Tax=Nocardiopsis ansamitocini TaxID=1670832 RepID=A0A9W6P509_9ACTN|nr:type II secretion system F family protein [Nocardiopsis ansamitocini]GLU47217.1 membrane protein [Nocardiopsis ansamitocini]
MTVFDAVIIGCAGLAGFLLADRGRSTAERRLAMLGGPPIRSTRRRIPGAAIRILVSAVPTATLCLLLGAGSGLLPGLFLGALTWWKLGRAPSPSPSAPRTASLPIVVDLLVAALRAGSDSTQALEAVAESVGGSLGEVLGGVAHRLRLGAEPADAWNELHGPPELTALGRAVARASRTGAPLADVLELHAADCRRTVRVNVLTRSQRVGVSVVGPLGLCFLPAFVLIGVVPLAAGLIVDLVSG